MYQITGLARMRWRAPESRRKRRARGKSSSVQSCNRPEREMMKKEAKRVPVDADR